MASRVFFIFSVLSFFLNAGLFDFTKLSKSEKLYSSGDYNGSAEVLKGFEVDSNVYRYDMANNYYKAGRYKEAIKYYKRAFGDGVDELARIYNLGNCYFKLQDYESAILAYKTALKIRDDKDVKDNLALAIKKLHEPKKPKKQKDKKKKKEKNGKSKKKNKKKLSKKELQKLKETAKKKLLQKELKKMLNSSLKERKVEVLMYRVKEGDTKHEPLNPW